MNINPMQLLNNFINNNTNPIFKDLIGMAQRGDNKGIENFAINFCKEIGIDYPKEFPKFMENIKNIRG